MIKKNLFASNNARLPSILKSKGNNKAGLVSVIYSKIYKIILNMGIYILNDMRVK